jgi:hypothetical protein
MGLFKSFSGQKDNRVLLKEKVYEYSNDTHKVIMNNFFENSGKKLN